MSVSDHRLEGAKHSVSLLWPALLLLSVVLCYVLSTGPVCRWSYRAARKIYAPLNPLANSAICRPLLKIWLSVWGAAPWWPQPAASGGVRSGYSAGYAMFRIVDGKSIAIINGVPSNVDIARLKQAGESGDAVAQFQLGTCLYDGKHGVATNYAEAYKWICIAATNGQKEAKYLLSEMDLFLTSNDLATGRAAAMAFESGRGEAATRGVRQP